MHKIIENLLRAALVISCTVIAWLFTSPYRISSIEPIHTTVSGNCSVRPIECTRVIKLLGPIWHDGFDVLDVNVTYDGKSAWNSKQSVLMQCKHGDEWNTRWDCYSMCNYELRALSPNVTVPCNYTSTVFIGAPNVTLNSVHMDFEQSPFKKHTYIAGREPDATTDPNYTFVESVVHLFVCLAVSFIGYIPVRHFLAQ